jgi:alkylation response protein AidB-like acyl-CoA dehydrogenase
MAIFGTRTGSDEREESVRMIGESASAVLKGDRARARAVRFSDAGLDRARLSEFAELGWMTLRVSEADGGLGLGVSEMCALARQLGCELTPEPVPLLAIAAARLPTPSRQAIVSGEKVIIPIFAPYGEAPASLVDGRLIGRAEPTPFGASADAFLVQTTTGAALVQADGAGVSIIRQSTHDGGHLTTLSFSAAKAQDVECSADTMRDEAALALSAYLLGVSETAFEITKTYLRDRRQFGQPIGSFQALQHRMVDLYLEISLLTAAVETAAESWDSGSGENARARLVSLAKGRASRASLAVTQASIQLHGGIGYSDEADIGLFLRKAMTLAGVLGTERFHRERAYRLLETEA